MSNSWMIYGANGYTGELIAEAAVKAGERPVLAGRRAEAIAPIASRLGLEHVVFSLDDPAAIDNALKEVSAVLLTAGPFSRTSRPMVEACLRTGTHYLDITGEISVFEDCLQRDAAAKQAGSVIMPGVGFDVVPSDCLAASLAAALPDADSLELAFRGVGSPSQGTAKTMLETMPSGGAVRENGAIRQVPWAYKRRSVPFRDKTRTATTIPWGDVSSAYYSTAVPNIAVYMAMPSHVITGMKIARPLAPLLALKPVQKLLRNRIEAGAPGPDENQRQRAKSQLWGQVSARDGRSVTGTLVTPEGYQLTIATALESAKRVARGDVKPGAYTPSMAFGPRYITEFDGCELQLEQLSAAANSAA